MVDTAFFVLSPSAFFACAAVSGAILFCDISGFTPLTARLTARPDGVEVGSWVDLFAVDTGWTCLRLMQRQRVAWSLCVVDFRWFTRAFELTMKHGRTHGRARPGLG